MDESDSSGHTRVLVVEDHADSRDMMRQFLEHAGMVVTTAATAEAALAITLADRPALVLTDLSLGGGVRDGVWLLRQLQRVSPTLPVIAVTGRKERSDELLDLGFAAVLVKPAIPDDVVAVIRRVITRSP